MDMEITGFNELKQLIDQLGKVPQKVATRAASAGARIDLSATKAEAPVFDGWLKASLKMIGERANKPGKKVYEITFDRAYNSKLVKTSEAGKRSYYPVSQEYGWKYKNGGYHVGMRYMKNAAEENKSRVEQRIIDVAKDGIEKVLSQAR
jgi:hypothetical protein